MRAHALLLSIALAGCTSAPPGNGVGTPIKGMSNSGADPTGSGVNYGINGRNSASNWNCVVQSDGGFTDASPLLGYDPGTSFLKCYALQSGAAGATGATGPAGATGATGATGPAGSSDGGSVSGLAPAEVLFGADAGTIAQSSGLAYASGSLTLGLDGGAPAFECAAGAASCQLGQYATGGDAGAPLYIIAQASSGDPGLIKLQTGTTVVAEIEDDTAVSETPSINMSPAGASGTSAAIGIITDVQAAGVNLAIFSGQGGSAPGNHGGSVEVFAGSGYTGGQIFLQSGPASGTTGRSGAISLQSGAVTGGGTGGDIVLAPAAGGFAARDGRTEVNFPGTGANALRIEDSETLKGIKLGGQLAGDDTQSCPFETGVSTFISMSSGVTLTPTAAQYQNEVIRFSGTASSSSYVIVLPAIVGGASGWSLVLDFSSATMTTVSGLQFQVGAATYNVSGSYNRTSAAYLVMWDGTTITAVLLPKA